MYEQLKADLDQLTTLLDHVKDESLNYLRKLEDEPTNKPIPQTSYRQLSAHGTGLQKALEEFKAMHFDKLVASAGPRYWGFVTGGATPAAIAGDWLTSVYDQNTQSAVGPGGTSAIVEQETISLMLQ